MVELIAHFANGTSKVIPLDTKTQEGASKFSAYLFVVWPNWVVATTTLEID